MDLLRQVTLSPGLGTGKIPAVQVGLRPKVRIPGSESAAA